jgi:pyridoxamine 5'-phosphate oxidase
MAEDPLERFRRWYRDAERAGIPQHDACALATADRRGRPSVRFVLLKGADERGFVFFTDARSRKGRELAENPRAALAFYWHDLGRQVRVEGPVRPLPDGEADAYWVTRPRESRLGAWASFQSAPLSSRAALLAAWRALRRRYRGRAVPRPSYWRGYVVVPEEIEFWVRGRFRLHSRERFTRRRESAWRRELLYP